ncbi:glycosyltransferase family 87 protein [Mycobacterium sp. Dal123C01]|uniref:glycosyltransferase family 87 protein n=1 Tax=Mycobacterium sp. Dal123C01 TaxID=3457577 RepID=UPI00403EA0C6
MNRPAKLLRSPITGIREGYTAITGQSARTILLGTILLASALSGFTGFVITQYFAIDAISSLLAFPYADCYLDWGTNIGRHCFSDYAYEVMFGMRANPWQPFEIVMQPDIHQTVVNNYPAAGTLPPLIFGLFGKLLGAPVVGLLGYLLALTIAVLSPAMWAARGARGLERIVVFVACGAAAVPVWSVIDRANSVGFLAPIGLVFLLALVRQRWGLVAVMVVLAALLKPQFVVLAIVLFAARQWRWGGIAIGGAVVLNAAAYLLWPQDFPHTIMQSAASTLGYAGGSVGVVATSNVSFGRSLLLAPDILMFMQTGGKMPDGYLAGPRALIGYVVLVLVVVGVLALGRRIPPVMAGIALLVTAALFPIVAMSYYFVFALPIAALLVRDPDGPPGSGIFERLTTVAGQHRTVGIWLSVSTALTIATIALPSPPMQVLLYRKDGPPIQELTVLTTATLVPMLWLVTLAVIIVTYARKPATDASTTELSTTPVSPEPASTTTP